MQTWTGQKMMNKSLKNQVWERFGLHLGGGWKGLGTFLGALGHMLTDFWSFLVEFLESFGTRWPPRGVLDRLWESLGRVWAGFWEDLIRFY